MSLHKRQKAARRAAKARAVDRLVEQCVACEMLNIQRTICRDFSTRVLDNTHVETPAGKSYGAREFRKTIVLHEEPPREMWHEEYELDNFGRELVRALVDHDLLRKTTVTSPLRGTMVTYSVIVAEAK